MYKLNVRSMLVLFMLMKELWWESGIYYTIYSTNYQPTNNQLAFCSYSKGHMTCPPLNLILEMARGFVWEKIAG